MCGYRYCIIILYCKLASGCVCSIISRGAVLIIIIIVIIIPVSPTPSDGNLKKLMWVFPSIHSGGFCFVFVLFCCSTQSLVVRH